MLWASKNPILMQIGGPLIFAPFLRGIRKVDQSKPENKTFPESRKNTFIRWPHAMGVQKSDFYANRSTSYFRAIFTWYKER